MSEPKPFSSAPLVHLENRQYQFQATARPDGAICINADNGPEAHAEFTPQQVLDIAVNLIGLVCLMQVEFASITDPTFEVFANLTGRDPSDDGTEYAWLDYLGD